MLDNLLTKADITYDKDAKGYRPSAEHSAQHSAQHSARPNTMLIAGKGVTRFLYGYNAKVSHDAAAFGTAVHKELEEGQPHSEHALAIEAYLAQHYESRLSEVLVWGQLFGTPAIGFIDAIAIHKATGEAHLLDYKITTRSYAHDPWMAQLVLLKLLAEQCYSNQPIAVMGILACDKRTTKCKMHKLDPTQLIKYLGYAQTQASKHIGTFGRCHPKP